LLNLAAHAQVQKAAAPPAAAAPAKVERIILHLSADPVDRPLALGMELLIADRLIGSEGLDLVPRARLIRAAEKGNVLQAGDQIYIRDIPYLCLSTEASRALVGWVEREGDSVRLYWRVFDGVTAANLASSAVEGAFTDLGSLIGKAIDEAGKALNLTFKPVGQPLLPDFAPVAAVHLGLAWRNLEPNPGKSIPGFVELLAARDLGALAPRVMARWLPLELGGEEASARPAMPPLAHTMTLDLAGEAAKALDAYAQMDRRLLLKPETAWRYARLLVSAQQSARAVSVIQEAEAAHPKNVRFKETLGLAFSRLSQPAPAQAAYAQAAKAGSNDPAVYLELAAAAAARGDTAEAGRYSARAGEAYEALGRRDLASVEFFKALEYGAPDVVLDGVDVALLDDARREALAKRLDSSQGSESRARAFARARLAAFSGDLAKTEDHLALALAMEPDHEETNRYAGFFYLDKKLDIDKAIAHFTKALKRLSNDPSALKGLARVYLKANFCDKALSAYDKVVKLAPQHLPSLVEFAEARTACKDREGAQQTLSAIQSLAPDYSPVLAARIHFLQQFGEEEKAKETLALLRRVDLRLAREFEPKPEPVAATPSEEEKSEPTTVKKPPVEVTFPVAQNLIKAVPLGVKRVALLNHDAIADSVIDAIIWRLTSFKALDPTPFGRDVAALLSQEAQIVEAADIEDGITIYPGLHPFKPASFGNLLETHKLDAIVLYRLTEEEDVEHAGVKAELFCFARGKQEILHAEGTITLNTELLERFNPWALTLPILGLLALTALVVWRLALGSGGLKVRIRYDQTFEDGYFALRLSRRPLKQAFDVKKLMKTEWTDSKSDTERKIRAFFESSSRFVTMAEKNRAAFVRIPPGDYTLYVTGIMVNIDTRRPIGTHEINRPVKIERDKTHDVEVDLELAEAYVEIRVTREVKQRRKEVGVGEGGSQETEREIVQWQEVGGASIEINDDPALTKISIAGEPTSYSFPPGAYRIVANYHEMSAIRALEIADTTPQIIEMRLAPKSEARTVEAIPLENYRDSDVRSLAASATKPSAEAKPVHRSAHGTGKPESARTGAAPIELSSDVLGASGQAIITHDAPTVVGESAQGAVDLNDLFQTAPGDGDDLFAVGGPLDEAARQEYIRKARQLQQTGRYEEAAELYLRCEDYEKATEMAQKSGNQAMIYKVYGVNYLKQGVHREAAEMFKFADEPLLEAEALEGMRLFDEANRKRGQYWEQVGDLGRAIQAYTKANAMDKLGMLHERLQNYQQAGEAYFKARLFKQAADCFLLAKDVKHAADAFDMDGQYAQAADLYKQLGSNSKVFHLLEKAGRFCEAAEGFKKIGLLDEAVHACQQVRPDSSEYLKAALIMGKIFIERNEQDLARSAYHKVVTSADLSADNVEPYYEFGVIVQEQGFIQEAYALFERLQTVKYNFADVSLRLQNLKERVETERRQFGTMPPPGTIPPFPGFRTSATQFGEKIITPVPSGQTPSSARYVFEKELGRGAMGIVYRARDTALDRDVAYKTVANAIKENPAALKYFLSEAKSLAALNHVNIVTVFDVGQEADNYFITMEFVDGRSLAEFIREKGRLSTKNVVVIASKIAAGLEYAHSKSVIHRDVKPSNIMISNEGEVKIMDFGLAKIMNEAVQDKTIVRGTPLYMSPEQVEGVGVDSRSDVYSFGVTMFEMATGTLPFTKGDIAYHHLHTPPPSPVRYNPSIPEALERIVLKCLEKKKEDRYESASEVKRDLAPLRLALMRGDM